MRRNIPLITALVIGLALRLYFAVATPIGSASQPLRLSSYNDELAHGNYALHVLKTGKLPIAVESVEAEGALDRGQFENYQPPLYYQITAGLSALLGQKNLNGVVLAGRFLNVALFALLLAVFIAIARALNIPALAKTSALIFLALNGVMIRFSSTATNEVLFWLLGGLTIWSALTAWNTRLTFRSAILFALFSTVALYTKLTAILLLPLLLLFLWRDRGRRTLLIIAAAYAIILLVTIPLWLRNVYEFGALVPVAAGFGQPHSDQAGLLFVLFVARSFVFPWWEFWQGWIGLILMLPLLGWWIASAASSSSRKVVWRQPILVTSLLAAVAGFVWLNLRYDQAEARYLFAAWPVLALLASGSDDKLKRQWLLIACLLLPYGLFILPAFGL